MRTIDSAGQVYVSAVTLACVVASFMLLGKYTMLYYYCRSVPYVKTIDSAGLVYVSAVMLACVVASFMLLGKYTMLTHGKTIIWILLRMNESLFKWSWAYDQDGCHAHI